LRKDTAMQFSEYQNHTGDTAIYPSNQAEEYLGLKLASEAGEVAGKIGKFLRDDYDWTDLRELLAGELGDVLWYVSELCNTFGLDMGDIAKANLEKLADRQERGMLHGSGDDR
jgi:NTP pyrophosphatase (non-canonical NTP hydrolase)